MCNPYRGPSIDKIWLPPPILVSHWLISKKKSSSLKLLGQMNRHLVCSMLGRSSIKIVHLVAIFIWLSSFKGEDFLEINQSVTRIACGGHVC
jgi:hypothetical protein